MYIIEVWYLGTAYERSSVVLEFLHQLYPIVGTSLLLFFFAAIGGIPVCFFAWALGNVHTHDHLERRSTWSQAYKILGDFFLVLIMITLTLFILGMVTTPSAFGVFIVGVVSVITTVIFWMEHLGMRDCMRAMQKAPALQKPKGLEA